MRKIFFYITIIFYSATINGFAQKSEKIVWKSFEDAVTLNSKFQKKVFIDVYTDWCGWCKVYDKSTFPDTTITRLMNKYFIAVKLNAERKDTVVFNGYTFVNPNPDGYRSPHQLASSLLKGRMSYPTVCFLDDSMRLITTVASYLKPADLEPILVYIGSDKYLTMTYDSFKLSYKPISAVTSSGTETNAVTVNPLLRNLNFVSGKSDIPESSYSQLDSLVSALKINSFIKIGIGGYTDNSKIETANKNLSENRAKAVYDYLLAKGIESTRMSYTGYGQINPVGDNSSEEGKKLNRRVEIKIISN
jgi:outer membrane protein OmpA-like peptidoglycan-associated protein/thiol-disulfide isomerase/thioredoxin